MKYGLVTSSLSTRDSNKAWNCPLLIVFGGPCLMDDVRARGQSRPSTRLVPSSILILGEGSEGLSLVCSGTSSLFLKLRDSLFRSFSCILEREDKRDLTPGSSFSFSFLRFFLESSFFFVKEWRRRLLGGEASLF